MYWCAAEEPLIQWNESTGGCGIVQVRWSRSRPSVFFVVDDQSHLYVWDLLMDDSGPLKKDEILPRFVTLTLIGW